MGKKNKDDLHEKMLRLEAESVRSEQILSDVEARSPFIVRMRNELTDMREHNHFTDLLISTVGAQRRWEAP